MLEEQFSFSFFLLLNSLPSGGLNLQLFRELKVCHCKNYKDFKKKAEGEISLCLNLYHKIYDIHSPHKNFEKR